MSRPAGAEVLSVLVVSGEDSPFLPQIQAGILAVQRYQQTAPDQISAIRFTDGGGIPDAVITELGPDFNWRNPQSMPPIIDYAVRAHVAVGLFTGHPAAERVLSNLQRPAHLGGQGASRLSEVIAKNEPDLAGRIAAFLGRVRDSR